MSLTEKLGWQPDRFANEVLAQDVANFSPVRVTEVHSNGVRVVGDHGVDQRVRLKHEDATVGDWLLLDHNRPKHSVLLERKSLLKRKAPGKSRKTQLIAANIDTLFIVTSCNQDFNIARLERYVALALEAQVSPVIVVTKADLIDSHSEYIEEAQNAFQDRVPVVAMDARGDEPTEMLQQWCRTGQTVAFVGSSGVGKSTLTNALMGTSIAETKGIREDDDKGRHTTTGRHLHISNHCAIIDTPGMREIQLLDAATGVATVFEDLEQLAKACRFNDCRHDGEPGCAICEALDNGTIDQKRFKRWQKLATEDANNSATLAQRKSKDKALGKKIRQMQKSNRKYN